MISKPEFTPRKYEWVNYEEFEALKSFGDIANLFEELAGVLGRVPTQDEFVAEGFKRSEVFFKKKGKDRWLAVGEYPNGKPIWHNFQWEDERLQKAVKHRIARSYFSHMVEYSTILQLKEKYPEYKVGASDYLDGIMGVDIVVGSKEYNKVLYIHVTSASGYSDHWLRNKEGRDGVGFDKDGNKHYYKRNFKKGHVQLAFSKKEETYSTEFVNGIPMFKDSHIQQVIEVAMILTPHMDSWEKKEQLVDLHKWLIVNDIDSNGLGCFWI